MHPITRRTFIRTGCALGAGSFCGLSRLHAEPAPSAEIDWTRFNESIIPVPDDPARWPAFRAALHEWRRAMREKLHYSDALYRRAEFAWVPASFACCFLMLCDETFYDHQAGRYAVEAFLGSADREFGGFDSVVLWHAYPRIGLDDRNQFDFYRDMPGGLDGLKALNGRFHARGLKVYIDYNPWDTGTRREGGSDIDALARMVQAIDADGIFLDTMNRGAAEFRAQLDAARPGVVLESEGALPLEYIHDHHMSWAQGFRDSPVPGVLRNKWFERRHMQHQIDRWNHDHSAELHAAWMNGSGMMIWENVFGSWVGWTARDRSILRAMLPIQRRYAALFAGENWTPLVPTLAPGVYASLWEGDGLRLWTLVNRAERKIEGPLLETIGGWDTPVPQREIEPNSKDPSKEGVQYYDLIRGSEIKPLDKENRVVLAGRIGPRGIGCFLSGNNTTMQPDFAQFLQKQSELNDRADVDAKFPARAARLCSTPTGREEKDRKHSSNNPPSGMVATPGGRFHMKVVFRSRECGFYESDEEHAARVSVHPLHQPRTFERDVELAPYAIDLAPVTNAQFLKFLAAAKHRPKHPENFLKHWKDGRPPAGLEEHPVVYVDIQDARAFAQWAGKRLPTEEEWQYAAQSSDDRRYPWGNEMQADCCNDGRTDGTTPVAAFPKGRSPFGCYDMCGNTWEWTESEREDGRTRFCIIRGGSFYKAKGSDWYMDGGPQPCDFAAKFLLMWPGLDRCGTVGFRCAV